MKNMQIYKYVQRWIQVLWVLKPIQFLGPSLFKKKNKRPNKQNKKQNYECKIRYKSEYLCGAPSRALEGAHASEEPLSLILASFTVNPSLNVLH